MTIKLPELRLYESPENRSGTKTCLQTIKSEETREQLHLLNSLSR
jgi:hypothetical protein